MRVLCSIVEVLVLAMLHSRDIVKLFSFLDELSPPEVLFRIVRTLFSKKGKKEERSFPTFEEK